MKFDQIRAFITFWQPHGWKGLAYYVKHCRISKMFHKEHKRLEISVQDHSKHLVKIPEGVLDGYGMWLLMYPALISRAGVIEQQGLAPKGDLETQISNWLEVNDKSS